MYGSCFQRFDFEVIIRILLLVKIADKIEKKHDYDTVTDRYEIRDNIWNVLSNDKSAFNIYNPGYHVRALKVVNQIIFTLYYTAGVYTDTWC